MASQKLDEWYRRTSDQIEAKKAELEKAARDAWVATFRPPPKAAAPAQRPAVAPGRQAPSKEYKWTRLETTTPPPPSPYKPLNEGQPLSWPLPGRYELNKRNPAVEQGDGNFGPVRTNLDGSPRWHYRIDITAPVGTRVVTAGAGRVVRAGNFDGPKAGYGNLVEVDHGDGQNTLYAHLDTIAVRPGDQLLRGQSLGTVGKSGNVGKAQSHLHFGDGRKDNWRNPYVHLNETAYGRPWDEVRYLNPTEVSRLYGMD